MTTINSIIRSRIAPSALSLALLICSTVWFVAAAASYATSGFQADWSATPLFWMLVVVVAPAISFATGMILVGTRQHSRFSRLDWGALVAALFPVTLGTLLAVWTATSCFR